MRSLGISCALLVLLTATPGSVQVRGIHGSITDERGQVVADASIVIELLRLTATGQVFEVRRVEPGQTWSARSRSNGEFFVDLPAPGVYVITASKPGFESVVTQVELNAGTATVNMRLSSERHAGTGVDVCGSRVLPSAYKNNVLAAGARPALVRLVAWLEAVQRHVPGCRDGATADVGRWDQSELAALVRDVREVTRFLQRAREERTAGAGRGSAQRDRLILFIHDRRFTLDQLERNFSGGEALLPNDLLKRGAVLHADIATSVQGARGAVPLVTDGGQTGWVRWTVHWEISRQLIGDITPRPSADADARLWFRAASAHLLQRGRLDEATMHLEQARRLFPGDPAFLLDSAYLHQELSSPAIQASVERVRADDVAVQVGSPSAELQRVERFLRQAAAVAPDDPAVHLRLGRTLSALGRHQDGAAELRRVLELQPSREQHYLAALFLGAAEQAMGQRASARGHFQAAATLYPYAQSAHLALAQLARESGDRPAAIEIIKRATIGRAFDFDDDPWWAYYQPHRRTADHLVEQMRRLGRDNP
jgi:tetratricopeptide (TPR) repeat protein